MKKIEAAGRAAGGRAPSDGGARLLAPRADCLYEAPAEVLGVAEFVGAMSSDIEDVSWSHRGECCIFDTMIDEFEIATPALNRVAVVVCT